MNVRSVETTEYATGFPLECGVMDYASSSFINVYAILDCILSPQNTQLPQLSLNQCAIHTDTTMAAQFMTNLKEDTKLTSAVLAMSPNSAWQSMAAYDILASKPSRLPVVAGIVSWLYRADLLEVNELALPIALKLSR